MDRVIVSQEPIEDPAEVDASAGAQVVSLGEPDLLEDDPLLKEGLAKEGEEVPDLPEGDVQPEAGLLPPEIDGGADLPLMDPLYDDVYDAGGLLYGEPDAFRDLDVVNGPIGIIGQGRSPEAFDAGVRQSELLPGGFQSPLDRQGFRFGVGAQTGYDSNIFLDEMDEVSDFTFTLSPSVEYRSAPAGVPGLVTVQYAPFIRRYLDESDMNTVDHSASAGVQYTGARGSFSASTNYGRFSHADRYSGGQQETESFSGSVSGSYQLASRTSLEGSLSGRTSSEKDLGEMGGGSQGEDDRVMQAQLAAYWQATAKTRFGPSVRYSRSSSGSLDDREAFAFLLVADYTPRNELSLSGGLGIEEIKYDGSMGGSDSVDWTGNLGVNYRPNDRFTLGADLSYEAIPQGTGGASRTGGGDRSLTGGLNVGYSPNADWSWGLAFTADAFPSETSGYSVGDQNYSASVTRRLAEGSLSLEGSLGFSDYDAQGGTVGTRGDEEYRSVSFRYQRPVFAERGNLHFTLQWSENSGDRDWSRFQTSLGTNFAF